MTSPELDDRKRTAPGDGREPSLVAPQGSERRGRTATVIRWTSTVLWGVAATCLGAWSFSEGRMWYMQRRAMAELDRQAVAAGSPPEPEVARAGSPAADAPRSPAGDAARGRDAAPVAGEPLATLSIPRVGLSSVVLAGVDGRELAVGVGHFPGTPLPGQPGNVALAGHRDSVFRPLRHVHPGDRILLRTPQRVVTYVVRWTRVVDPDALWVLRATGGDDLTLVTCYPFEWIGHAPKRFVVRAAEVAPSEGTRNDAAPADLSAPPGAAVN